ncbi:MAG: efflux RND transporter permease subunit [Planctomycetes bacterium]|nr:efflux RND transporter permease subunit [Planctomycetota bacterium]
MSTADERSLFHFCISRPVAITMVTVAICVFGLVGLSGMAVNLLPDVAYPTITVRTEFAGASPRDVEERVSERVQELVAVVPGIRRAWSVSRPGISDVVLEFGWGTTMTFAAADVRERLDRFFPPPGAEKPIVLRYDPSQDPVLTLSLSPKAAMQAGETIDLVALRRYADLELEERLAQIEGVAAVKLRGGDVEEIHVALDEQAMAAHGIDIATVTSRLANENMNAASGAIEEGRTEFLVRALNEYQSLAEIENTILVSRGNARIRLREVAKVTRRPADPQVIARVGGEPCVLVDVFKQADANIVEVCRQVRERVLGTARQRAQVAAGEHEQPLPLAVEQDRLKRQAALRERAAMTAFLGFEMRQRGIGVELLTDQSKFVQAAIDEVGDNAWQGGLLAVLVLYLFLRSGFTTMVLAVSIPASLIATFAPLFLGGIDLNIMSLGGLALGVGMLLDNSIVVLESITRLREGGADRTTAVVEGTRRIASAVFASTLTQVAVFFPIVFVEGLAGQLFRDLALTVVYAQLISIPVALFVVPMLAARGANMREAGQPPPPDVVAPTHAAARAMTGATTAGLRVAVLALRGTAAALRLLLAPVASLFLRGYSVVERLYAPLLRATLARPLAAIAIVGLALGVSAWRLRDLGQEILPEVHQGEFYLEAYLARSATVLATDDVLRGLEQKIRALPDVERTFLASGVDPNELNDSEEGKHSARVQIVLRHDRDRPAQEQRVRAAVSAAVAEEPAILTHRFTTASVLRFSADLVVEVIGHDLVALRRACDSVATALQGLPGLGFVRSTLQRGNPELTIRLDRDQLAVHGLDAEATARMVRTKVLGDVPTLFAERERKIDIRVRVDRDQLASEERLRSLNVNPAGYPEIPLAAVGSIERREGPSEIRRLGNVRGAEVHAEVRGFDLGRTQLLVEAALTDVKLPDGVIARLGAQKEELERSNQSLLLALAMAVFLVYIVMAAQFESIVQPLIILVSVPLALIGVVLALDLLAIDVSVVVFLGCIVLAGIVVNNAIILIDQINQLRSEGVPLHDAVLNGAQSRLRPVMMTMLTTLIGLLPQTGWLQGLPLIGGQSDGIELRSPMAITVIGGLVSSTLLTLLLVPLAYRLVVRERRTPAGTP